MNVFTQDITYENCIDTLDNWIEKRVENAKNGKKEFVEMPFVVRSFGWGCECPEHYIGISPYTQEGPWISPLAPKNFPKIDTAGYSLIVKGYFTGKMIEEDLRDSEGMPEEWLYKMPEFKIKSWQINEEGYNAGPPKIISTKK